MATFADSLASGSSWALIGRVLGIGLGLLVVNQASAIRPAVAEETLYAATSSTSLRQLQSTLLDLDQIPLGMAPNGEAMVEIRSLEDLEAKRVISNESVSEQGLTTPSLWWQQMQTSEFVGTDRLILGWLAYDREGHTLDNVDVMVNGQIWNLLNYLEQYSFLNQFGRTAKSYGYQLRIFAGEALTGTYTCNFSQVDINFMPDQTIELGQLDEIPCGVSLDYLGRGGIRGSRR